MHHLPALNHHARDAAQLPVAIDYPVALALCQDVRLYIDFGFAPIFPDTCYHLTHYWLAAVDIPV
ncbi:hypothetical protein SK425_23205, partial [Escherichia coli]|nr:hypothetical protein [Escherichia coli]